jgi:hypothetical protein
MENEITFLTFEETFLHEGKTKRFNVLNREKVFLGRVFFKPQWRKYVFEPHAICVFDDICLKEIQEFLYSLFILRREELKNAPK